MILFPLLIPRDNEYRDTLWSSLFEKLHRAMELVIIPDGLRFRGWLDDDWEVSHRDICDCNLIINYHFEIIFGAHDSKIGSTILYNIEVVYCNLKLLDESQCFFLLFRIWIFIANYDYIYSFFYSLWSVARGKLCYFLVSIRIFVCFWDYFLACL